MAKSLSQITFDFSAETAETQPITEFSQTDEQKAENYALQKPTGLSEAIPSIELNKDEEISAPDVETIDEKKGIAKTSRGRRSLKSISFDEELINIPDDEILFQKYYYAIGEVALMFNVNTSLLRYWETEFTILQPRKNRKGDRHFRPEDIKNLYLIFDLLRRRKFTIEGAKDYLKKNKKVEEKYELIQSMEKIKSFLLELKAQL